MVLAVLLYVMKRFNLKYGEIGSQMKIMPFGKTYAPIAAIIELSTMLKLKTLDLLHIAYITLLKNKGEPIHTLITVDKNFENAKEYLRNNIKVNVSLVE